MLTLLLSLCLGLLNAARGRGYNGMKVGMYCAMYLACRGLHLPILVAFLFPFPLLISWWTKGGTGRYMPYFTKYFEWMYWEFIFVFCYSITTLSILQIVLDK